MIHPQTELVEISDVVGWGVIATEAIPRGTITWALDALDRSFSVEELEALGERYRPLVERWTFHDGKGRHILCWDIGRYVNHSCDPNCAGSDYGFEIALRDIEAGEQLTNDYATFLLRPSERFDCHCGASTCRGLIGVAAPDAAARVEVHRRWRDTLGLVESVPQPLGFLVPASARLHIRTDAPSRTNAL